LLVNEEGLLLIATAPLLTGAAAAKPNPAVPIREWRFESSQPHQAP
jgi:hypothetical protein